MRPSLKNLIKALLICNGVIGALVGLSIYQTHHANQAIQDAQERRLQSSRLADELRQSSDDLTRLARTYVVTGDPKWEKQYFEVLDIRNGKAPARNTTTGATGTSGPRMNYQRSVAPQWRCRR